MNNYTNTIIPTTSSNTTSNNDISSSNVEIVLVVLGVTILLFGLVTLAICFHRTLQNRSINNRHEQQTSTEDSSNNIVSTRPDFIRFALYDSYCVPISLDYNELMELLDVDAPHNRTPSRARHNIQL